MKKLITLAAITLASLLTLTTVAQPLVKKIATDNAYILTQADSVKSVFEKDGFVLSKSSAMTMESNNELPVILSFTAGTNYRIVFISENTSSSCEMKLMDWNDKQVASKKSNSENIIAYDYTSKATEYHMIKPVQTNENAGQVGGYFMIFKKN
jgi:UDP-N-acetyl-D-mannosaminuronate dehydrogenase